MCVFFLATFIIIVNNRTFNGLNQTNIIYKSAKFIFKYKNALENKTPFSYNTGKKLYFNYEDFFALTLI